LQLVAGRLIVSPSDLNDFVECAHLVSLAREVATGARPRPRVADEYAELLRAKGEAHEQACLDRLRAEGRDVVAGTAADPWDFAAGAEVTAAAMRAGAEVIYQGTFVLGQWRGRADFLERVARPTALGEWGYEPVDAKLAREEKPTYVLQLCLYAEAIAAIQGAPPEAMHVLLGIGERRTLRHPDFAGYYRRARDGFAAALARADATEPYPVEYCGLCEFRGVCGERWVQEDHLSLVAGVRREQVPRLRAAGLHTLTALAHAPAGAKPDRVSAVTLDALRDQAALQLHRRRTGELRWHPLPVAPARGFGRLPRPSAGDLVFDIEGDPFWEPARGLHFLFGLLLREGERWEYRALWAHDRDGERRILEDLVDLVHERLARHPDMHVYHYGAYESTAVKQLMGRYGTREDAVDALLRRQVLVDLYTVVHQGLRAGVASYSLKDVEALAAYARRAAVTKGAQAVLEYEQWMRTRDDARLHGIAAYNEDDCRAALALRDWLLANRPADADWAEVIAPPADGTDALAAGARDALRRSLTDAAEPGSPRWLAGELLEYHRREARPAWWWFFTRSAMSAEELIEDAEAIGGLEPAGRAASPGGRRLCFPAQQHKMALGDSPVDPATGKSAGVIESLDERAGELVLRRSGALAAQPLPAALIPSRPYDTSAQQAALGRLATSVAAGGRDHPALLDVLAGARPRLTSDAARDATARGALQTTDPAALRALARGLNASYLFIQGPPGTGKTWTGARIAVELMRQGRRVGVTATSHKAIHNLLDEIEAAANEEGWSFTGIKKSSAETGETVYAGRFITSDPDTKSIVARAPGVSLLAGTAWLFAHRVVSGAGLVDTLLVDEAGQVALADALAMGTAARNLILLGDPLQLAQVSQGAHPPGTDASVLEHLLGGRATVAEDMGIFLERTRRMHPSVCRFISEIVYDGRLRWTADVERQDTAFGTGLRYVPVEHAGNGSSSDEEAARVAREIRAMHGGDWTDADGVARPLGEDDFMVVAPYNAQVRRLREALAAEGLPGVPVGTVDKFQGREAAVVFYSMATSSADDVPRNLAFLFSRNRLNVAVSRARCLAHVVASPRLLESRARSIEQMRLVNALCRFAEMAEEHRG